MLKLRKDFPYLKTKDLIYFDNAATSQKPKIVIDSIVNYYSYLNAPVHRGIYKRAELSTDIYNKSRSIIANFLSADFNEIIFTKGTTESINFVAESWAKSNLKPKDEIIISKFEHHSNILPWLRLIEDIGVIIKYIPVKNNFDLDYKAYLKLLSKKTKLVAITSCSNAIGTNIDLDFIIKNAKLNGAKVLIDAAQSIAHKKFNLKKIKPDFFAFSAHKILGPTGIGVLYISKDIQKEVRPYQVGGGMVLNLKDNSFDILNSPECYEAGTPLIAQAVGFAKAIEYINSNIDFDSLCLYESKLCSYFIDNLKKIKNIKILGFEEQLKKEGHIVSFNSDLFHPHDIAAYLDQFNIAVRAGFHCAQPLFNSLDIKGSVRVSFYFYNSLKEIDFMISKLKNIF